MKLSIKNKSNAIIASLLVGLFFFLHYHVYLGVPFLRDSGYSTVPVLQSYTDAPVDLEELSLCEEKRPSYFNPFQKIQYRYQVMQDDNYSECNIVEEAESIFTSRMKPVQGDPKDYFNGEGENEGPFMRPLVSNDYANLIFFIVQYLIIAGFFYTLFHHRK